MTHLDRLIVLLKQRSVRELPEELRRDTLRMLDRTPVKGAENAEDVRRLVERIEAETGLSSSYEGIIASSPTYSVPPEVPTSEPGWSRNPPPL
jgi:hypothetical protein